MTADGQASSTSDATPVESKAAPTSETAADSSTTSDSAPAESKDVGGTLTKDQLDALGISANGVEGMTDQEYARLRYEQAANGDPLHDGDLRSLYGVASTPAEDLQKAAAIAEAVASDDPFVAARGRAVGDIPATPEQQAAYDAAVEKLEVTNAATAPLMDIERQRELMGGATGAVSAVEQARWDQANIDYHKALAGDPYAYQSLQQELSGVTPSDHDLALFIRGGGAPVLGLERQFQLAGGNVRPQEHIDRLNQLNADLGAAAGGDAAALKRVEGALGMDRGALTPDMLAPGGAVLATVQSLGVISTAGLVPGNEGLLPGIRPAGAGTGAGPTNREDPGTTSGTGGADPSGASRPSPDDALGAFGSAGTSPGAAPDGPGVQGAPGETSAPTSDVVGGATGSGGGASPWDDALAGLQAPPSGEPGFTEPRHSGSDGAAPASPSMDSFGSGGGGSGSTPTGEVLLDDAGMTTTGGQDITSESVTTDLGGGRTQTTSSDGTMVVTGADGTVEVTMSGADFEETSKPSGDTTSGDTTSDDTTSDDTTSGDTTSGDTTTDDTGLTTGEGGPISPNTKAALDFLGYPETTITRAGTAGPDYGQGDPGASGDTGGGDAGGGGSSGDGSNPEPMTTGEGGSVLVDPGTRNPTAGPDVGPGIPGESPEVIGGVVPHGPVTGGPGMDPTIAMGGFATDRATVGSSLDAKPSGVAASAAEVADTRAATTDTPAFADDFSTSIMGGLAAPAEVTASYAARTTSMDLAAVAPAIAEAELPPVGSDEMKIGSVAHDDVAAGGFDLSAKGAAFEIAPVAIDAHKEATAGAIDLSAHEQAVEVAPRAVEAPPMEAPVLEHVDPVAALEPPPDESGLDQMEGGPLP
jgi:hypothetical protein